MKRFYTLLLLFVSSLSAYSQNANNPAFKFNCPSSYSSITPSTFTNTGVAQYGTITIPITTYIERQIVKIQITEPNKNDFSGSYTITLLAGQSAIIIPISFDGSTTVGTHTLSITSLQGEGTCTLTVLVKNKFEFNCATTPATITPTNFVNTGTPQAATVTLPISNAVAGSSTTIVLDNSNGLGNDFAGQYVATLMNGQTSIIISTNAHTNIFFDGIFDGTGTTGTRTLTFKSFDAASTCTVNVTVSDLFNFNCATTPATITPNQFINNGTPQSAIVTLPLKNVSSADSVFFSVTDKNSEAFSVKIASKLSVGQTSINIPIAFKGNATVGNHTLIINNSANSLDTCSVNVVVNDLILGTEATNNEIKIFPNPVTDKVVISLESSKIKPYTLKISNLQGRTLQTIINIKEKEYTLSLKNLTSGIYILEILNGTQVYRKKIIKE